MGIYKPAAPSEIIGRIEHIRDLHRQIGPKTARDRMVYERREKKLKDFLSNLRRTGARAMVPMIHELEELCGLVTGAGYKLFGYDLDAIREYDYVLNGHRTHIVESHIFERDFRVELPLEFTDTEAFQRNSPLKILIPRWQSNVPIHVADRPEWRGHGIFYVHVGTEDSFGSALPPGSLAQVEIIGEKEALRPWTTTIYLLQFPNGYRFSRCVVAAGKLQLLVSERAYTKREEFPYPSPSVRIVGKLLAYALQLPQPEHSVQFSIVQYRGTAATLLPWEHKTRASYLATEHKRFVRSAEEFQFVQEFLRSKFPNSLGERTRRRLLSESSSEPHVDFLIQVVLENFASYFEVLRVGGHTERGERRFTLEMFLQAKRYADLMTIRTDAVPPVPQKTWEMVKAEIADLAPMLLMKFPRFSSLSERLVRIADKHALPGLELPIGSGSWMLLEDVAGTPDVRSDELKHGWKRSLYALYRGIEIIWGHLEREGTSFILRPRGEIGTKPVIFEVSELRNLRRIAGMLVRVS